MTLDDLENEMNGALGLVLGPARSIINAAHAAGTSEGRTLGIAEGRKRIVALETALLHAKDVLVGFDPDEGSVYGDLILHIDDALAAVTDEENT